jgi:L-serine dehydratase
VLLGLEGHSPEAVDPAAVRPRVEEIRTNGWLLLGGTHEIEFSVNRDRVMHRRKALPLHPNGMRFTATDRSEGELRTALSYSVGGGFHARDRPGHEGQVQGDRPRWTRRQRRRMLRSRCIIVL